MVEIGVSAALLAAMLATFPPMIARLSEVDDRQLQKRLAVVELANLHQRRLADLDADLAVRDELAAWLPQAEVTQSEQPLDGGWVRIDLELSWQSNGRQSATLSAIERAAAASSGTGDPGTDAEGNR